MMKMSKAEVAGRVDPVAWTDPVALVTGDTGGVLAKLRQTYRRAWPPGPCRYVEVNGRNGWMPGHLLGGLDARTGDVKRGKLESPSGKVRTLCMVLNWHALAPMTQAALRMAQAEQAPVRLGLVVLVDEALMAHPEGPGELHGFVKWEV